jgi:hypothetical protein
MGVGSAAEFVVLERDFAVLEDQQAGHPVARQVVV